MENNYVVIMAGGSGTRLYPFSRDAYPKQFQDILGIGKSLLQLTIERFEAVCPMENIYIVTNEKYQSLTKEQLPHLPENQILIEPYKRNTAPCIAYACYRIYQKNTEANIVVTPADHLILKQQAFEVALHTALNESKRSDALITLGIKPNHPNTGYGYIQLSRPQSLSIQKVKTFTEKPDPELAKAFMDSGDFVWNAGIFVWTAHHFLSALKKYAPEITELFEETIPYLHTDKELEAINMAYSQCRTISIDYAVMEKANNVYVLPCDLGWSDLGTWKSLYEHSKVDENRNVVDGEFIMTYETTGSMIKTSEDKLMLIQGLEDYIVINHDRVLLICQKSKEKHVKRFLEDIKIKRLKQFL